MVMTTMGLRKSRPPLCMSCGQRKDGLYTFDANGRQVCADCADPREHEVLKGVCDPENCACGKVRDDESDA